MERLPFDASRISRESDSGGEGAAPGDQDFSVTQLTNLIKDTLERRVPSPIRVVGEVSNLSARNHWYFSLKDEQAVIGCVAWASTARRFGFVPSDGDEVVATGHVSFYGPQGRTQLYVSKLEPVGAGALEIAFRKLCEELRREGYFDPEHKQPLPVFPRRIAVITSRTSAAAADVKATALQRCPAVGLLMVDSRVQGADAAEEVAHAIDWVDANHEEFGVDAILVTRGGGSMEDLWTFNERVVADAAWDCSIPIVAAIGHESDTTVIELVADRRAATPTQAVMLMVPHRDELSAQLDHWNHRLQSQLSRRLDSARKHIDLMARHEIFRQPERIVSFARDRIDRLDERLTRSVRDRILNARHQVESQETRLGRAPGAVRVDTMRQAMHAAERRLNRAMQSRLQRARDTINAQRRQLDAVDPSQVLKRGYSLTRGPDGSLVRSAAEVTVGDRLVTMVADGAVTSTVTDKSRVPRSRAGSTRKQSSDKPQLDLFSEDG